MKTFICIIMVAMATAQDDGAFTTAARTINNIFNPSVAQPEGTVVNAGEWRTVSSAAPTFAAPAAARTSEPEPVPFVGQPEGTIVDASEWYTVPNNYVPGTRPRGPVGPVDRLWSLLPSLIGALTTLGLVLLALDFFNMPDFGFLRSNPQVAEVMAAIEESIPAEGRSLENLLPMAKEAFEAIEKFTALNEQ
jgi:hypothetical protein